MPESSIILDESAIKRGIVRISHEILEKNKGIENLVIIGIRTGGAYLAEVIASAIKSIENEEIRCGAIDITLYRDDFAVQKSRNPVGKTEIPFSLEGKKVVLVDDVLFTGRTIRAAMDAMMDYGRPACVQLAVLIDRGHRELPIRADFVGRNVPTSLKENVVVEFDSNNQPVMVVLEKK